MPAKKKVTVKAKAKTASHKKTAKKPVKSAAPKKAHKTVEKKSAPPPGENVFMRLLMEKTSVEKRKITALPATLNMAFSATACHFSTRSFRSLRVHAVELLKS